MIDGVGSSARSEASTSRRTLLGKLRRAAPTAQAPSGNGRVAVRRPRLAGLVLVGTALLFVEIVVGFSLFGDDATPGAGRSTFFYVSDTFRGGPVPPANDIEWQVPSGEWRSDGSVATATEPNSALVGTPPAPYTRVEMSVTWRGSPVGTTVKLAWTDGTSWTLALDDDGYELHDGGGVLRSNGPMDESLMDSPTLRFTFSSSALALYSDTRQLAEVETPVPSTDSAFTILAGLRGISIDRVELKMGPPQ